MNRKKLVVGLGNPGPRYAKTPHNLGFEVVDMLAADLGAIWNWQEAEKSRTTWCFLEDWDLLLAKPQTYMNLSGEAVELLCHLYSFPVSDLIVVCDDLALPAGSIRIRSQGSAGGHNGLKSIIEVLARDDFTRVRLGIAPDVEIFEAAEYVLTPIPDCFREDFDRLIVRGKEAVRAICLEGVTAAMNQFN